MPLTGAPPQQPQYSQKYLLNLVYTRVYLFGCYQSLTCHALKNSSSVWFECTVREPQSKTLQLQCYVGSIEIPNLVLSKTAFFTIGRVHIDTCSKIVLGKMDTYNFKNLPDGSTIYFLHPLQYTSGLDLFEKNPWEFHMDTHSHSIRKKSINAYIDRRYY